MQLASHVLGPVPAPCQGRNVTPLSKKACPQAFHVSVLHRGVLIPMLNSLPIILVVLAVQVFRGS
jgi:hypothetical protein